MGDLMTPTLALSGPGGRAPGPPEARGARPRWGGGGG